MNRYKFVTLQGEKTIEEFTVYSRQFKYEIETKNGIEYVKVFMR